MPYYGSIQNPIYKPAVRDILSITQTFPAIVTTTFDGTTPGENSYLTGLILRLFIPSNYGMVQLNQEIFTITVLTSSTFSIPVDARFFDPFVIPAEVTNQPLFNPAQCVPVGESTDTLDQTFINTLTPQF